MTIDQRSETRRMVGVIRDKLLGYRSIRKPSGEALKAMACAVVAIGRCTGDHASREAQRHQAVLSYHLREPEAMLFRDDITLDALAAGADAMERLLDREEVTT